MSQYIKASRMEHESAGGASSSSAQAHAALVQQLGTGSEPANPKALDTFGRACALSSDMMGTYVQLGSTQPAKVLVYVCTASSSALFVPGEHRALLRTRCQANKLPGRAGDELLWRTWRQAQRNAEPES